LINLGDLQRDRTGKFIAEEAILQINFFAVFLSLVLIGTAQFLNLIGKRAGLGWAGPL